MEYATQPLLWSKPLREGELTDGTDHVSFLSNQRKCEWMAVPYRTPSELSENICNAAQRVIFFIERGGWCLLSGSPSSLIIRVGPPTLSAALEDLGPWKGSSPSSTFKPVKSVNSFFSSAQGSVGVHKQQSGTSLPSQRKRHQGVAPSTVA